MRIVNYLAVSFLSFFAGYESHAQTSPDSIPVWHAITKDGNAFFGQITARTDSTTTLRNETVGLVTLENRGSASMRMLGGSKLPAELLWHEMPHSTRYLFMPNGYGLRRGKGYYQNTWVMFNQANIRVTDHFSVGIGTIPLFFLAARRRRFGSRRSWWCR